MQNILTSVQHDVEQCHSVIEVCSMQELTSDRLQGEEKECFHIK